jgi:hypothetical protein
MQSLTQQWPPIVLAGAAVAVVYLTYRLVFVTDTVAEMKEGTASARGAEVRRGPAWLRWLGWTVAWLWAIVAGGGGFGLILTRGPLPLTNGWFAMFSGLSACPLAAWLLKRYAGITVPVRIRVAAAVFIMLAGRIAVLIHWYPISR